MTENEIKAIVSQSVEEMASKTAELNQLEEDCDAKILEANAKADDAIAAKAVADTDLANTKAALESAQAELSEANTQLESVKAELESAKNELNEVKAAKKVDELNSAIASFTDEEKNYAQAEIDAFNANPMTCEVNSVVNKILEGVGKKVKEAEAQAKGAAAEMNSAKTDVEDIFSEVGTSAAVPEDTNIF